MEMYCCCDFFDQIYMWQIIFQGVKQWFDQMVVCVEFVQWLMVYVFDVIFQIWVFKMIEDFLNVCCMFVGIKIVVFDQYCVVFFYCVFYYCVNIFIENSVVNGLMIG